MLYDMAGIRYSMCNGVMVIIWCNGNNMDEQRKLNEWKVTNQRMIMIRVQELDQI